MSVALFEDEANSDQWIISVYVGEDILKPTKALLESVCRDLTDQQGNKIALKWSTEELEDLDWVTLTLQDLSPVRAGRFIVHGSHDADIPRPHEFSIVIDAGQAFGTGHHGTTAACLELMADAMRRKRFYNVLDLGTGSAVLAIAAAKMQPVRVLATDIDPIATEVARHNVQLNGVAARVRCQTATGINHRIFNETGPFDLIVANILARPLEQLSCNIARQLSSGGTLILSGLLPHQKARIISAYRRQGLSLDKALKKDGWLALSFKS